MPSTLLFALCNKFVLNDIEWPPVFIERTVSSIDIGRCTHMWVVILVIPEQIIRIGEKRDARAYCTQKQCYSLVVPNYCTIFFASALRERLFHHNVSSYEHLRMPRDRRTSARQKVNEFIANSCNTLVHCDAVSFKSKENDIFQTKAHVLFDAAVHCCCCCNRI